VVVFLVVSRRSSKQIASSGAVLTIPTH
jgi:hypothetical protein